MSLANSYMRFVLLVQGTHFWESDELELDPGSVTLGIMSSPYFFIYKLGVIRRDSQEHCENR